MRIDRRLFHYFDWSLLWSALALPLFGLLVLYSAGYNPDYPGFTLGPISLKSAAFQKQFIYLCAGLCAMVLGIVVSTQTIFRLAYVFYLGCLLALVAVLGVGTVVNGSRRWISFGAFNLQPAEPMKLAVIAALARYITKVPPKPEGYGFKQLIVPALILLIPMALIMKQPDLGSALVIGAVGGLMLLFVGINKRTLLIGLSVVLVLAYPIWHKLHDYQKKRVLVLFDPESDPLKSGYHITQSKIAVGSGAFWGKGYFKGTQTQLEFLPEHTTDFIFSVLAEEWGFVGSTLILGAFLYFIYKLLRVVLKGKDFYSCLVVFGIASMFFFHAAVNIGMVVGILPVVGIPLPFFSYGGSAVVCALLAIGIALGVSMRRLYFT